ncbi:enoyl-CoA hydratase [Actinocrinis sp.]|uniref:enoyl-CoA hydratase n=1 Tax=Actinocrinis sp. TaxID=1920516 RepID=UPI002C70C425|nr:enoyl-CoA hydratase [Actinocrinis sp.]HXR70314.1 enoyl-CoA hydratase [Actinocrinis sp.]
MVETVRTPGTTSEVGQGRASVRRDVADGIVRLTLTRGDRYNPLSRDMIAALQAELDALAEDGTARVVVLAAEGRGFCAGHDMAEMRAHTDDPVWQNTLFAECNHLMITLNRIPQPVIARVHGIATAAGCQLVSMCDLAVAAATARFALPGVNVGVFCSTPAVGVVRNVARKRVMELLLTGDPIDAATARDWGLVNRVVAATELDDAVRALTDRIVARSASVIALGKRAFYAQVDCTLGDAYAVTSGAMTRNLADPDAGEGIDAFLEKRPANWRSSR